jgi:predicted acetyltransferase
VNSRPVTIAGMPLLMKWVGDEERDRVAETRFLSYARTAANRERFTESIRDPRAAAGDFLLAQRDGRAVGTATSLSMTMWIRGAPVPCQGVAWVGTIRTERRGIESAGGGSGSIARAVMEETLRMGRQRQQVVSALMPFRASFYERFGYGLVERRVRWLVPLSAMPRGAAPGWRDIHAEDYRAQEQCFQRAVQRGQCDIERTPQHWEAQRAHHKAALVYGLFPDGQAGATQAYFVANNEIENEKNTLVVAEWCADSTDAFESMLRLLGTLSDEFSTAAITTGVGVPLNRLLREGQIPHRLVEHATASPRPYTRMQIRVLDHPRMIESMRLAERPGFAVTVTVRETEGHLSTFRIDAEHGRAVARPTNAAPDFECTDRLWSGIVCGDIAATDAARWGLAKCTRPAAVDGLDILAAGPPPFCNEYF